MTEKSIIETWEMGDPDGCTKSLKFIEEHNASIVKGSAKYHWKGDCSQCEILEDQVPYLIAKVRALEAQAALDGAEVREVLAGIRDVLEDAWRMGEWHRKAEHDYLTMAPATNAVEASVIRKEHMESLKADNEAHAALGKLLAALAARGE